MASSHVGRVARFILETFGPLIVFYAFEHLAGLVPAILATTVVALALVILQAVRDKKVSPFTAFIAASVIGFGILDLRYQTGFFIKIEPALGNAATGLFFLGSVLIGRPLLIELAERSIGKNVDKARGYLTLWTVLWSVFFFVRAAVYVWMAYEMSIDGALLVRGIVGPASFLGMFGIEMAVRFVLYGKKAFGKASEGEARAVSGE
jgi:intracellular septation protein A